MTRAARTVAPVGAALILLVPGAAVRADGIRDDQWHLPHLNVAVAHGLSQGDGVVVAVIDSGVDSEHPDIGGNVLAGVDLVPGGTGDGRQDSDGHGTGMAALIAGHGREPSKGILGIAPRAKILPVRIATDRETGDTGTAARAIDWAVEHSATIICVAHSGGVSRQLIRSVQRARGSDIVIVAAAGNRPERTGVGAPASLPGVIAAAATDRAGNHDPDSVTGPEVVLAAPGVDIVSASRDGGYRDGTGTSDAAAIIAGAAALVRARFPDLSAEQVVHRLTATADDRGPVGRDERYGYGVLNLVAALTADLAARDSGTPRPTGPVAAGTAWPASRDGPPVPAGGGLLVLLVLATGAVGLVVARNRRT